MEEMELVLYNNMIWLWFWCRKMGMEKNLTMCGSCSLLKEVIFIIMKVIKFSSALYNRFLHSCHVLLSLT